MSQATEQIASQFAAAAGNKSTWNAIRANVKAYGAKGDGVTDDYEAFLAAFKTGYPLEIPEGTYLITQKFDFPSMLDSDGVQRTNIRMYGGGTEKTIIKYTGTGFLFTIGRHDSFYRQNIICKDIQFTTDKVVGLVNSFQLRSGVAPFNAVPNPTAGCTAPITDGIFDIASTAPCTIENCFFNKVGIGIKLQWGYNAFINNNRFWYNNIALFITEAQTTSMISNNTIEVCAVGVYLWVTQDIVFYNNVIEANYAGADIVSYNQNENISFIANYFEASPTNFDHNGDSGGQYQSYNYTFENNEGMDIKLGNFIRNVYIRNNRFIPTGGIDNSYTANTSDRNIRAKDNYILDSASSNWAGLMENFTGGAGPEVINENKGIYATVNNTGLVSIPTSALTAVSFDSEVADTNRLHDSVTNNSRVTVPETGMYMLSANITFAGSATGSRKVYLRVDGATFIAVLRQAGDATENVFLVNTPYALTKGQYVEVIAFQDSGASLNIIDSRFTVVKVNV